MGRWTVMAHRCVVVESCNSCSEFSNLLIRHFYGLRLDFTEVEFTAKGLFYLPYWYPCLSLEIDIDLIRGCVVLQVVLSVPMACDALPF